MRIWVDTDTGTWGDPEVMVIIDITQDQLNELDEMSDSERIGFAHKIVASENASR